MEIELDELSPAKEDFIKLHQTTGWNAIGLYMINYIRQFVTAGTPFLSIIIEN